MGKNLSLRTHQLLLVAVAAAEFAILVFGLLWLMLREPGAVSADHIPEPPDEIKYTIPFNTSQPDMFGPNGARPFPGGFNLLDFSWNEQKSVGAIQEFGGKIIFFGFEIPVPTASFGGELGGGTNGRVAVDANLSGFDAGQVSVNYPIEATLLVPKADKHRRGDEITIGSSWRLLSGATLETTPPAQGRVSIDGTLELHVSAFVEVCLVVCTGQLNLLPISIPLPDISDTLPDVDSSLLKEFSRSQATTDIPETTSSLVEAIDLGPKRVKISANEAAKKMIGALDKEATDGVAVNINDPEFRTLVSMLPGSLAKQRALMNNILAVAREVRDEHPSSRSQQIGALTFILANFTPYGCCEGEVGTPQVRTTSSVADDGRNLVASASDTFIKMNVNPSAFIDSPVPLTFDLNSCEHFPDVPLPGCAELGYIILSMPIDVALKQSADFTFRPNPRVSLQFSEAVNFKVSPCAPDPRHGTFPCKGRSSVIVYDLGSVLTITVPSGSFHLGNVTPTFSLPSTLDNRIVLDMEVNGRLQSEALSLKTPSFQLIPPIVLIPEICIEDACTPELKFPGLTVPSIKASLGPLKDQGLPGLSISNDTLFDRSSQPWVLGGFGTVTGDPFGLDAEIQPTASFTGPAVLDEGEEGTFSGTGTEIDFGEFLTYEWDYGDGIRDFGDKVSHFYADNGTFTVSIIAADEHQKPGVASKTVRVDNVAPTLVVGGGTFDEGVLADLSLPPFNRELLKNRGFEEGTKH